MKIKQDSQEQKMKDQYIMLTAEEVAAIFRVDSRTVNERYAYQKTFPAHIKVGNKKLWKQCEIYAHIDALQNKAA